MSPSNVEAHTIRAVCNHFADKPKYELDYEFAREILLKLPDAKAVYGYATGEDEHDVPHSWIRVGDRDYDVQLIAQRLRAYKLGFSAPPDRVLTAKWNNAGELDDSYADMNSSELVDWFLPSCAACRRKKRAHTLDGGCTYARKAEYLERRVRDWESIKNVPLMFFKASGDP